MGLAALAGPRLTVGSSDTERGLVLVVADGFEGVGGEDELKPAVAIVWRDSGLVLGRGAARCLRYQVVVEEVFE